mgnify:FL=1
MLGVVEVDRCPAHHGVWFDNEELRAVLEATAMASSEARPPQVMPQPERTQYADDHGQYRRLSNYELEEVAKELTPPIVRFFADLTWPHDD